MDQPLVISGSIYVSRSGSVIEGGGEGGTSGGGGRSTGAIGRLGGGGAGFIERESFAISTARRRAWLSVVAWNMGSTDGVG